MIQGNFNYLKHKMAVKTCIQQKYATDDFKTECADRGSKVNVWLEISAH